MLNVKDDYRLAMVEVIHPDAKGLVRTVTVKFRRKNKKEPSWSANPGTSSRKRSLSKDYTSWSPQMMSTKAKGKMDWSYPLII